ncbi:hypothetical protein ZEMLYA_57 [Streptomyces phage Zemlya]|uniref:Uncharacterized protein n=2 Tax=Likavirus TaxID=1982880 RepID=R4T8F7_9CAUD|nr:hypothetical protein M051_gp56 [Streptomyces phage Lika]YP_008060290.1 hypothetical protein M183_gp57 [Streptomyces phage Zemlya]AGM12079.1 hypothetical protein LIKA_56 [Streptomyces phage Lika]AGM12232.1 hypothetical protein ZEMLYA_57 [Streptomyces phage Zemlya]
MKTVRFVSCRCGVKRGFLSEREAEKALGRAQAKRNRTAESRGTRRGIKFESRWYVCDFDMYHLTSESRSSYESRTAA